MTRIGLVAAVLMLAGGVGVAAAQTSTVPSTSSSTSSGKCWDTATNQVRDKSAQLGSTSGAGSSTAPRGTSSGTMGSAGGGTAGSTMAGTAGSTAQTRPAGMPSC